MTYPILAAIVAIATLAAGTLSWLVRTRVNLDALRRHHEVGSAVFLQLGVVYAVLLAFVFYQVWTQYNTAAQAINAECGALHGAAILAGTLPEPMRHDLLTAEAGYLRAVTDVEWPAMARGQSSPVAMAAFETLVSRAATDVIEGKALATRSQILDLLAQAHAQRETRLFQLTLAVPKIFWVLLVSFGLALTGLLLCFGVAYVWSQVTFTAVFSGLIAFVLLLVAMLDFPFDGALRLRPTDFRETLNKVMTLRP
jgi:hypothetical protein